VGYTQFEEIELCRQPYIVLILTGITKHVRFLVRLRKGIKGNRIACPVIIGEGAQTMTREVTMKNRAKRYEQTLTYNLP
jgi:hypothetical protein